MNRLAGSFLPTLLLGLLAAVSLNACAENETSLFIRGNVVLTPPSCIARSDPSTPMLGTGTLDVAFSNEYTAALLVGNQLTPRGEKERLKTETMAVELSGAEVSLTDLEGNPIEAGFSVPATGFIDPNSGESPGYGVVFVDLIPTTVGNRLATQLRAAGVGSKRTVISDVRVFGTTLGGTDIETGNFTYPISVCYGCTVVFPRDALDTDADGNIVCALAGESVASETCYPIQDTLVDCRSCVASNPDVCLSPG